MKCPFCGDQESKVVDSRHSEDGLNLGKRIESLIIFLLRSIELDQIKIEFAFFREVLQKLFVHINSQLLTRCGTIQSSQTETVPEVRRIQFTCNPKIFLCCLDVILSEADKCGPIPCRIIRRVVDSESVKNGFGAIICAAGMAAHLAGAFAANTTLPVIGIPISCKNTGGVDALWSTVQMPSGIPVATVAIDGAANAALLAVQMLSIEDKELAEKLNAAYNELSDCDGIVVLSDLPGGSPFKTAVECSMGHPDKQIVVLSGTNLPMIIAGSTMAGFETDPQALADELLFEGKDNVVRFEMAARAEEEDDEDGI